MQKAIIAAAAACLVVCGCSSDGSSGSDGKAGSSGTAGSNGAAGQTGATGPTGPTGPAGAKGDKGDPGSAGASATSSKNGSRIKVATQTETTADGLEVVSLAGYVDTSRANERCSSVYASDGMLRCMPIVAPHAVGGAAMWDSTCTTPMSLSSALTTGSTKYVYSAEIVNADARYRIFAATPIAPPSLICSKGTGGSCTCRSVQAGESVYANEFPATDFASVTRTFGTL